MDALFEAWQSRLLFSSGWRVLHSVDHALELSQLFFRHGIAHYLATFASVNGRKERRTTKELKKNGGGLSNNLGHGNAGGKQNYGEGMEVKVEYG